METNSLASGIDKESGSPRSPDQMFCVYCPEEHTCVYLTAVSSVHSCTDLGTYFSPRDHLNQVVSTCVSGLQGVSRASRATSSFRNRWCYIGLHNYKLIIIAVMGTYRVQSMLVQQQEKSERSEWKRFFFFFFGLVLLFEGFSPINNWPEVDNVT